MSCNITIDSIIGKNPDSLGVIQGVEVTGTADCEKVMVYLAAADHWVEAVRGADSSYTAVFDLAGKGIKCGTALKVKAYCKDNPNCQTDDAYLVECPPSGHTRPRYVSYYDCTEWNSNAEVMNLQDRKAKFTIILYRRDGSLVWKKTIETEPHETKRVPIDKYAPKDEGLVVVEPTNDGWEFPSVLCITNAKTVSLPSGLGTIKNTQLQRFVPFTRIP